MIKNLLSPLRKNVPLAPLTTFGIGGSAQHYIRLFEPQDLARAVMWAKGAKMRYWILAGGSNVVISDTGLPGLVIHLMGGSIEADDMRVVCGAGISLEDAIDCSMDLGWKGLERLSGIPGTVGGAIIGNAGAYGQSVSDALVQVEIWDGTKKRVLQKDRCRFAYRHSIFKEKSYIVLRAVFSFTKDDAQLLKRVSEDIVKMRKEKYKSGIKCPGSFFKNIIASSLNNRILSGMKKEKIRYGKIPAGYLLDEVGARGMCSGDIAIADFHGNLFINRGKGKAKDVKRLAGILKEKVKQKFGIELEEEIRYIGM